MLTPPAGQPARDAGFTLIELLLVIVILGVITLPLANSVIGVLKNENAVSDRMMLSHDAQISTAFFAQDVAATGLRDYSGQVANGTVPFKASFQLNAAYNAGGVTCGTAATPAAVLRLFSDDWDASVTPPVERMDVVAYYLVATDLHRMKCVAATTTTSDVVVAHDVSAAPTVTCSAGCAATSKPQQLTLAFTVTAPSADPYPITLTGRWRQT
ncbi:MAG TPA: prepilin-type N-terminal cleavage/methylation domain-containing protein [Pseudonocardiaceae bacterium]